jgi:hypothetical protein
MDVPAAMMVILVVESNKRKSDIPTGPVSRCMRHGSWLDEANIAWHAASAMQNGLRSVMPCRMEIESC